jgi:glucan phosphoethanolaminetransferase (alkaline phosphatase superfamily)
MEQKIKNVREKILNYINSEEIHMHSKWYFIFKYILNIFLIFIAFLSLLYFISFILLIIYERRIFDVLNVSKSGFHSFMTSVPWFLIFLVFVVIIILEILIRKYSFVYKRPFIYTFFGIILVVLLIGFLIHKIDAQFRFARFGEKPDFPIIGPMHKFFRGDLEKRPFNNREFPIKNEKDLRFDRSMHMPLDGVFEIK